MREIVFDTETTGLDASQDRIVEIGGIEVVDGVATGRTLHHYVNPGDRPVHPDAEAVHGISNQFLADKPPFAAIADEVAGFFEGARLVAHNAPFDVAFLNAELARLGRDPLPGARVRDTLSMARQKFPNANNTLDGLCRRFGVDNSGREKHGALLDSELLAEVYVELTGGRQASLGLGVRGGGGGAVEHPGPRPAPLSPRVDEREAEAHRERWTAVLGEGGLWARVPRG